MILNALLQMNIQEHRPWDWDKVFVEIRNNINNPIIES